MLGEAARREDVVAVSALTGEGVDDLREAIARPAPFGLATSTVSSSQAATGARIAWLHARGEVIDQRTDGDTLHLAVKLSPENWARFQRL